jgi:isochorismate synthase
MMNFHQFALENRIAFVTYKLPELEEVTTLVQWKTEPLALNNLMELEGKSGFVFAPFNIESRHPIRLIEPDLVIKGDEIDEHFFTSYNHSLAMVKSDTATLEYSSNETPRESYLAKVDEFRNMITPGKIDKLVLSRISIEAKPKTFNPNILLQRLQCSYPDAFVFMIHIADTGLWIGASPEPLLEIKDNVVSTVSLAGTRLYGGQSIDREWGAKELEEQEIVTRYIDSILEKFNIKQYTKQGPQTKLAGAVEHLLTHFTFSLDALQSKIVELIDAIHPTPSVCGLPKDKALDIILNSEEHDREYYTGFLGTFNIEKQYALFVNLRCMKVGVDQLIYFLGAGITAGSDPEKEWEETNSKKRTLMSIVETLN